jgi:type I restriction enzyme S subunit
VSRIDDLIKELAPEGVQFVMLASVAKTMPGLSGKTKSDFSGGNARFVTYKNVFANLAVQQNEPDFVQVGAEEKQNRLHHGDVIFTGSSETADEVGMSSVVMTEPTEPLYLNSFCFAVRFDDPSMILPGFSKYLFRSDAVRSQIRRTASGVTRINISKQRFVKIRVPVPPIEVQREVVRVLDNFTELEVELEVDLEAELKARRRQYHHHRRSLLSFGAEVPSRPLGDLADNLDNMRKPVTRAARIPGEIPYFGASGIVDYVSDFIFDGDYLLVSEDGANLLARSTPIAFSITGKTWVNNHAHVLRFDNYAERRFVEIYLNSIDLSPFVSGATQPKLNKSNLTRIPVPDPSLDEKERLVSTLDKFDALVNEICIGIPAELKARRQQYEYYRDRLLTFEEAVA